MSKNDDVLRYQQAISPTVAPPEGQRGWVEADAALGRMGTGPLAAEIDTMLDVYMTTAQREAYNRILATATPAAPSTPACNCASGRGAEHCVVHAHKLYNAPEPAGVVDWTPDEMTALGAAASSMKARGYADEAAHLDRLFDKLLADTRGLAHPAPQVDEDALLPHLLALFEWAKREGKRTVIVHVNDARIAELRALQAALRQPTEGEGK